MEKVKIKTAAGIAKVAGLVVCMTGVAVLCFYKGPQLKPFLHHHLLESHYSHQGQQQAHDSSSGHRWIIGCFLLLVSIICWSLWLVLQVLTSLLCPIPLINLVSSLFIFFSFFLFLFFYIGGKKPHRVPWGRGIHHHCGGNPLTNFFCFYFIFAKFRKREGDFYCTHCQSAI